MGLEDAKGIPYSDTDLVIANKREQLWQNALMEAESKLVRDAKTKEHKNTSSNSSEYLSTDAQSETSSDMVVEKVLNTEWLRESREGRNGFRDGCRWLLMSNQRPMSRKPCPRCCQKTGCPLGEPRGTVQAKAT